MQRGKMNRVCYFGVAVFMLLFLARGAHAAGGSISGTVSYAGSQTGTIYVAVFTTPISCSSADGANPVSAVQLPSLGSYTISGLADGTYYLAAVIMTAGPDTYLKPTDPWAIYNGCGAVTPVVISGGNAATGKDMVLVDGTEGAPNPFGAGYSVSGFSAHESSGYWVELYCDDGAQTASSVTVTGPGITGSAAMTYDANKREWSLPSNPWFGLTPPSLPLTYTFSITDASGTTEKQVVIESYVDVFATNLSPSGGEAVTGNPVFSWTGVAGPYTYEVGVHGDNEAISWHVNGLTTTSIAYSGPALIPGHTYSWHVDVVDGNGNQSFVWESFVYQPAEATGSISGTVSYFGSKDNPVYVGVFNSPDIGPDSPILSIVQIPSPGAYTISGLPDGTYYVAALMTENVTAIQMTDPYGVYGMVSQQSVPLPVTISGGSAQNGIDFTMVDGTEQYPNPIWAGFTGSISGTISYFGSQTNPVYVALFDTPVGPDSSALYVVEISGPGAYTISHLPDGTYYVGAVMTQNIDAIRMTDPYGMYGISSPQDSPQPVTITGGSTATGIDFTIFDGTQQYPNPFSVAPAKIGVFDNGYWYLDSNMSWAWDGTPTDTLGIFGIGLTGAVPVVGDWNGDGTTKIGVFMNGTWYLDMNRSWQWDGEPTDTMGVFGVGLTNGIPVVGDWNGDGTTEIGIYQNGTWYLDMNGNWQWDGEPTDKITSFGAGLTGAVPVVGDWNGDGKTKIGIYQNGYWYLDVNGNGQWDGEPSDQLGVFGIGLTNAVPVVGDWNGDGIDEIGIFQQGLWYLDKNRSWQWDGEPSDQLGVFGVGLTGAVPVPGKW